MAHGAYRTAMSPSPSEVAQWRKLERERLIAARLALDAQARALQTEAIARQLDELISAQPLDIVSAYWPIRGEPDLRPWMLRRHQQGTRIALPLALQPQRPLAFRQWQPGARMAHGLWQIPYPADGGELTPTIVLAPLVGFDEQGYRLGYGGAFFDRTLALLHPRPLVIGVGYAAARIKTIFPQPFDVPMDYIVTGSSPPIRSRASLLERAAP